jgi:hypothetical protein
MMKRFAPRLLSLLSLALVARAQVPERVEFCHVFDRLPTWDGRMVQIDGYVESQRPSEGSLWFTGFCHGVVEVRRLSFRKEFVRRCGGSDVPLGISPCIDFRDPMASFFSTSIKLIPARS